MNGNWLHWIQSLHEKYGEVVRVAPDELSFHDSRAWNDIYGHRISGKGMCSNRFLNLAAMFSLTPLAFFPKDLRFYLLKNPIYPDTNPIVMENNVEEHGRVRKVFSHAFSNQALKKQEPLLLTHVTQFVRELQEKRGSDFDLVAMLNFVTFEMMSDLAFSESMGLFEGNQESIKWVESLSAELKMATLVRAGLYYPSFLKLLQFLTPRSLKEQRMYHVKRANERVDRRIGRDRKQTDIWSLTEREDADGKTMLSVPEMHVNAKNFLIAGTETTATALSALNYYLLKNPAKLKKLTDEIRASFTSTEDMSLERLAQLKYLGVCIDEGLRLHPPVPIGLGRIVPKGGKMISDYWVPEGVKHQTSSLSPVVRILINSCNNPDRSSSRTIHRLPRPSPLPSSQRLYSRALDRSRI